MAHDVFISHAHKDITIANAICDRLEAAQVKCWITERDIPAGENWPEATRNAIRSSRVMVLLLSENANAASHIEREIAHAFYTGRTIFPVRLTNTPLKRDFLYYLGNVRCFDAFNPPSEQYFDALVTSIQGKMRGGAIPLTASAPKAVASRSARVERKTLDTSDSWSGAMRPPHYGGGLQILKRVSVTIIFFSLLWLGWFFYSQGKIGELFGEGNLQTTSAASSPRTTPRASPHQSAATSSPPKPAYAYSRFGLWVAPEKAGKTEAAEASRPGDAAAVNPPDSATPSPKPDLDRDPIDEDQRSTVGESAETTQKSAELTNKPAPSEKVENRNESEKLTGINRNQDAGPLPTATTESTPFAEATGTGGATPEAETAPIAEAAPTTETAPAEASSPVVKAPPITEPTPITEATPAKESAPAVESSTPAESTPVAEATPATETTPAAEANPSTETTPASEANPAVEATPVAEATPTSASSSTVESTSAAKASLVAQPTPRTGSTPRLQATPKAEGTSGAESTPVGQSASTDDPTPAGMDSAPVSVSTPASGSTAMVKLTPMAPPLTDKVAIPPEGANSPKPSSDEQSLKQLVLDYMRTAASNDDSDQEAFFSSRINFYGKGILSLPQVRASLKRYRQEWPIRSWQPRGEPELPTAIHANHPELYEVLQPFVWTVANDSERKKGTAILYVRIRKDDQGNFRIIHLEQRQP